MDGPLLHLVLRTSKNVQGGTTMSAQDIIKSIEDAQLREVAEFKTGDTVRVHAKVKEGNRERIQVFEGTVIKRQNGGARETFTVRKQASGVGVEKTWPVHSPIIEKIEVVRRGKVRRAKLYYLRDRVGKAAKVKERCGENFVTVCPGVRPAWSASDDQKRIMTPAEAVKNGADYLVIGRPITKADDPKKAAMRILEEIEAVL